jgi:hypothetical protein
MGTGSGRRRSPRAGAGACTACWASCRPSYSPDYNPIEYFWKKVKIKATHNRYFAEFAKLIRSVEEALSILATQTDEIKRLMGIYTKHIAEALFA